MHASYAKREQSYRSLGIHIPFWCLILLSWRFFEARFVGDPSHYLWNIVNFESFFLPHDRYSNAALELFPLVATHLRLPLRWIAISYSVGIPLFNYAIALTLAYAFRRVDLALAYVVFMVGFSLFVFIWCIDDVGQGFGACFVLTAILDLRTRSLVASTARFLGAVATSLIALFFHPLAAGGVAFCFAFSWCHGRRIPFGDVLAAVAAFAIFGAFKVFKVSPYESARFINVEVSSYLRSLALNSEYVLTVHWPAVGLLVVALVRLHQNRRWLLMAIFAAAPFVYVALVSLTNSATTTWIYRWRLFGPTLFFAILGVQASLVAGQFFWSRALVLMLVTALVGSGVVRTIGDLKYAADRQAAILRMIDSRPDPLEPCLVIDRAAAGDRLAFQDKKVVDESMILTSYDPNRQTKVLIVDRYLEGHQVFGVEFNRHYFGLPDRLEPGFFTPLNSSATPSQIASIVQSEVSLMHIGGRGWRSGAKSVAWVSVFTPAGAKLPSRSSSGPVRLGWRWLNDDASKIEMLDAAILEVDVEGVYSLPVSVRAPENLEGARLVFGITLGGEWLGGENIDVADRSQFVASRRGDIALSPKMGLSRVEIDSSGKLTVFGWVLAAEKIDEIIVALDGSVVDRAEYPSPRPDVYQIYPEYGTTRSGFRFETQVVSEIPPASLPLVQVSARSAGNLVIESERVASRPPERLDP